MSNPNDPIIILDDSEDDVSPSPQLVDMTVDDSDDDDGIESLSTQGKRHTVTRSVAQKPFGNVPDGSNATTPSHATPKTASTVNHRVSSPRRGQPPPAVKTSTHISITNPGASTGLRSQPKDSRTNLTQTADESAQKRNVPLKSYATSTVRKQSNNHQANSSGEYVDQEGKVEDTVQKSPIVPPINNPNVQNQATPSFEKPAEDGASSSIGTNSPLIQRLKHKLLGKSSSSNEMTVEDLEKTLHRCYDDLKGDVAISARVFLEDAKAVAAPPSLFTEKVSPWGVRGQHTVRKSTVTTKIDTILGGRSRNSKSIFISTPAIRDSEPSVPRYTAITITKRNFLTADDEVLKFVPYFNQEESSDTNHKRLLKELETSYTVKLTDFEAELASQVDGYLDSWLANFFDFNLTKQALQRHILQQNQIDNDPRVLELILESLGGPLPNDLSQSAGSFQIAFQMVFKLDLVDVILPESLLKELAMGLKPPAEPAPSGQAVFSTFADFLCLVCGVAYCQRHGDYNHLPVYQLDRSGTQVGDTKYEYHYQSLGMGYPNLLQKHEIRKQKHVAAPLKETDLVPCSKDCHVSDDFEDFYDPWPIETTNTLKEYIGIFTNSNNQSCQISFALDMPCWQVSREIKKCEKRLILTDKTAPGKTGDRPLWYDNKTKTLRSHWEDMTDAHSHEMSTQFDPCTHDGPCSSSNGCTCCTDNFLCERMCGCSDDCGRRFTGCDCEPDIDGLCCKPETCMCLQLNRECGPECVPCGARDRINPRNKYDDNLFTTGCQNIFLQRGVPKQLLIGESTLMDVGFGAYVAEDTRKGEFIGEYVGEVISFTESERRAITYQRKDSSFLFDLNSDWTIDAARQGNKTRFINHASTEPQGLNCGAKVLFVNGEHRIKFTALRDIKAGEELLFNYGKKFGDEHFEKKLGAAAKARGKAKSVVLEGDDLDALDGLVVGDGVARRKMEGLGGGRGRGGRRRGKGRKTALPKREGGDEEVGGEFDGGSEVVGESGEEDHNKEGEDDSVGMERPKRKIRQPKRYTR